MKTVFMGTPDFAMMILDAMIKADLEIGYVFTQPDKARNRGKVTVTPVKALALEHGIEVIQPEKVKGNEEVMDKLREYGPDIIVVAAYGQIIPKEILELPRFGCINVHASLLPKYRGASPIQHVILDGEKTSGVTIMQMAEGLDTGDMLSKAEINIEGMTADVLHDELGKIGAELLVKTLPLLENGEITPEKQDDRLANYVGMIRKEDGRIDFENKTAEEIERQVRAFDSWPGAFCKYNDATMKIRGAEICEGNSANEPGYVIAVGPEGIDVACKSGILRITKLQMPGKKAMASDAFLRGNKIEIGTVLK